MSQDKEKKKKESILDLSKRIDETIRVKFQGGWEASGILKGFAPLLNLVLDGTIEYVRDPDDQYKLTEDARQLGRVVCRGTSVVLICPRMASCSSRMPRWRATWPQGPPFLCELCLVVCFWILFLVFYFVF
ncbi:U6 snRNA-associated Sm-like protein LSm7 [Cricetulus griseus]|uniref:U6 snRNA-associated Sm-like protein LSm7 n=1 Tax=Cricetulus griseus TaxID=10029 RepID=G3H2J1_CRIGR|nr:U6 snRNA-associated Sm-like protein LSm7 [Cricetulus griseus]